MTEFADIDAALAPIKPELAKEIAAHIISLRVADMTLRDYFAAKALPGICYMIAHRMHETGGVRKAGADGIADSAYEIADAMLKAREA